MSSIGTSKKKEIKRNGYGILWLISNNNKNHEFGQFNDIRVTKGDYTNSKGKTFRHWKLQIATQKHVANKNLLLNSYTYKRKKLFAWESVLRMLNRNQKDVNQYRTITIIDGLKTNCEIFESGDSKLTVANFVQKTHTFILRSFSISGIIWINSQQYVVSIVSNWKREKKQLFVLKKKQTKARHLAEWNRSWHMFWPRLYAIKINWLYACRYHAIEVWGCEFDNNEKNSRKKVISH